jgi:multidrug efflux system outer membrane protein
MNARAPFLSTVLASVFAALLAGLVLAGCATPSTDTRTDHPPPAADAWWQHFGNAELPAFVAAADAGNPDGDAAEARLRQAQAQERIAGASAWPALSGSADASREGRLGGDAGVRGNRGALGLDARYEVDLWGRLRAQRDGAGASRRASAFDRDAVRLAVRAGAASAWLDALGLRERAEIAANSLRDAERLLALAEARERAGAASALDVARQRGIVGAQRRIAAALRQDAQAAQLRMARWLGQPGGAAPIATASLRELTLPSIEGGVPADLLARRPDMARAEAVLAAADADVVAARAAIFPSLTLSAGIGAAGARFGSLLDNPVYSLAAALAAPIFDGGRLAAARDLSTARREELLATYRAATFAAFTDAQTALDAVAALDAQRAAQDEELAQATRALRLAESRYRAGAETYIALLDAQRTLFAAQDVQAQLLQARLQANVNLYHALGGGWNGAQAPQPQPQTQLSRAAR